MNKHKLFLNIVKEYANFSKCCKIKVGALIVKDDRILSTGVNGTESGSINCKDNFKDIYLKKYYNSYTYEEYLESNEFLDEHRRFSIENAIHAEINSIINAAKHGVKIKDSTMYLTYSPCINCAKAIVRSGIKEVIYENLYTDIAGINYLKRFKIKHGKIK